IWHEYAHALLDDQQADLQNTPEGRALHEGWADYWAGSYSRRLAEAGVGQTDWRRVYTWDGNNGCWRGRRLDHPGVYHPTDRSRMGYPAEAGCSAMGTHYQWGLLWATTLMEVHDALGADVTDRLALASLAYLAPATGGAPPMEVAAEALIAADRALYSGAHEGLLVQRLAARGFVDASRYGPLLAHTPLTSTEQSGGTRPVTVEAEGRTAAVQRVVLVYTVDGGAPVTVDLAPEGGTRYGGALPIPTGSATIAYYVEATDVQGRRTRLPAVDGEQYRFASGPDTTPPVIRHTPRTAVPVQALPPSFEATASDALGVAAVEVRYAVRRVGTERGAGTVALVQEADGVWRGRPATFPAAAPGDTLVYRIVARDRAAAGNEATSARYAVPITSGGTLAAFGAETAEAGVTFTGAWQRGVPAYGLRAARSGQHVYSTALTGPYPATRTVSALELAPLDLRSTTAYLTFWTWTDVERGGTCRTVCDGGRVDVSTTGGTTWTPLEVEGGYRDTVDARIGSDLAGQPVFEGDSYGWQRAVAVLPQGPAVRVRFVFATDGANQNPSTYGYAGWALDSIAVVTTRPGPGTLPSSLQQATEPVAPGAVVPIRVRVSQGRDLARVVARYEVVRGGAVVRADSVRLRQRPDSLTVFEASLRPDTRAGDAVRYRLVLTTAGGASTVLPETGTFTRPVRTLARSTVLAGAVPGGVWQRTGEGFSAFPPSETARPVRDSTSALVLAPLDLPANADVLRLVVRHRYRLGQTNETPVQVAGNVKLSDDDGRTWRVLPAAYTVSRLPETHPLSDEPGFTGRSGAVGADTLTTVFDLSTYAGQQVRVRFDLGYGRPLELGEFWTVLGVTLETATPDDVFETPRTRALSAPFPNPFRDRIAFAYTLPEAAPVEAALYDVLGRRVAVLASEPMQEPGTYAVSFEAATLAPGTYVLRVRLGAEVLTRTVVKVR
ncbi:MAG TPA: T9SS type A sorting domain-containing protein, partial [Rhodothermales bacterium]|nr:T9SS type A sorting domain-containing protein [Rhodothermales bacterium]